MNKILIVDASGSDRQLISGLLVKSGYEPKAAWERSRLHEKSTVVVPASTNRFAF